MVMDSLQHRRQYSDLGIYRREHIEKISVFRPSCHLFSKFISEFGIILITTLYM